MGESLYFPFRIGTLGVPRTASRREVVRQKLEQLLFTMPGERVNRPDYGCGVQQLVFSGTSAEAAAAAEFLISTNITRNLPEVDLEAVRVTSDDARLHIDILYTLLASGEEEAESFQVPLEAPP
jgi:phage baseplate assembly protein W